MTNVCKVCGKPATQSMLKDPFGKSDEMHFVCSDHGFRIRDPADVTEIERLQRDVRQFKEAIYWALGERENFPDKLPGCGPWYWRTELRKRSGLPVNGRPDPEPFSAQSKFDLAFDILRQMQSENMDSMQSVHFGYVLRVERENAKKSDEIRDLACCDTFVRESVSEFCSTCGYTNLDHLRRGQAKSGGSQ